MPTISRPSSLSRKIIAWSFVPTVLILAVVAAVNLYSYQKVTEDLVVQRDRELTRLLADQLGADLSHYVDTLYTLARYPAPDQVKAALLPGSGLGQELDAFDAGLVMLDKQGRLRTCFFDGGAIASVAWPQLECIAKARTDRAPCFSDILQGGDDGPSLVVLAVPSVDLQGQTTGVAAGVFYVGQGAVSDLYQGFAQQIGSGTGGHVEGYRDAGISPQEDDTDLLRRLYGIVQGPQFAKLRSGISGAVYVVDSQGNIIYHPDTERIGTSAGDHPQIEQVLQGRTGALRTANDDGDKILASFAPVPGTDWGLVTEESWRVLLSPSTRYGAFLAVLLALGIVLPTLVVTAGVRRIMRPLDQLSAAARQIAAGQLGQTIQLATGDELQDLAQQFNIMSMQLRRSYDELEQRVAERTAELTGLNSLAIQVSRSLEAKEIMARALAATLDLLSLESGAGYLVGEEGLPLEQIASQGNADSPRHLALPAGALVDATPKLTGQPNKGTRYGPAQLVVPLTARGVIVGLLSLDAEDQKIDLNASSELLSSVSHQTGLALENARLYDRAQEAAALEERRRLARDLHDSVTQTLYGASLYAQAASRLVESDAADKSQAIEHLAAVRSSVSQALRQMRLLIFELRPSQLDAEGLAGALRSRLEMVEARAGLTTTCDIDDNLALDPDTEQALYLICTEALNNALKHAQAQHVSLGLERTNGTVLLEIHDDGVGFDTDLPDQACGFGLPGMRERAARLGAELTIASEPGSGTTLTLEMTP